MVPDEENRPPGNANSSHPPPPQQPPADHSPSADDGGKELKQLPPAIDEIVAVAGRGTPASRRRRTARQRLERAQVKLKDVRDTAVGHVRMDVKLALREARHNFTQYCIGCSAVFIVVALVSILMTILIYSPVVFLTLAENTAGELDLVLLPPVDDQTMRLNYTAVSQNLGTVGSLSVPRISGLQMAVFDARTCIGFDAETALTDNTYTYDGVAGSDPFANLTRSRCSTSVASTCLDALCAKVATAASLQIIQTERERAVGIGRQWEFPPIPADSIYLHQNLARTLGVTVGDLLYLVFDWQLALPVTYSRLLNASNTLTKSRPSSQITIPVKVGRVLAGSYGKLAFTENTVAFIEWESILGLVSRYLPSIYPGSFRAEYASSLARQELQAEATTILVACSDYRVECYMNPEYNVISKRVVDWASSSTYRAGFTDIQASLPVLLSLNGTRFFSAFLNLIFSMVVILLSALSCFLIYSLLMVSVETKTFELGIFRMIGMTKGGVVSLISIQALSYSIPAWALGLSAAQISWLYIRNLLAKSMNIDVATLLASDAILLATALGVLVPLLASILPIRQALTGNLHDALDTRRPANKAVIVTIERNGGGGISSSLLSVGLVLTIFGFSIYYFLPMALLNSNITLLFNIFLILLIGMMFGLVMLSLNFEPVVERMLVKFQFLLLWFENRSMVVLVIKNLVAHRRRNRKTSIMYALSLGFIIFLTVAIRIELASLIFTSRRLFAGDIQIQGQSFLTADGVPFGVQNIDLYEEYLAGSPYVKSWSYSSFPLQMLKSNAKSTALSNIGRIEKNNADVKAAGPGFIDDTKPAYTVFSGFDTSLPADMSVTEHLYTVKGSYSAIIGGLFHSKLSLEQFTDKFVHTITYTMDQTLETVYTVLEPLHFADSLPYYSASEFPSAVEQDAVVSLPQYLEFATHAQPTIQSIRDVPLSVIFVFLQPGTPAGTVQDVLLDLTKISSSETISSVEDQIAGIASASSSLGTIFQAITAMAMVIAFFSLNSSMYTNIMEQKKEMGVLRALGLTKAAIFRLFSYEAFVLIFSAAILGTMIGTTVGWTMATQRSIITQVPLQFLFPWDIVVLVFGVSIGCSVLSTAAPIYKLVAQRTIVSLLK